MGLGKVDILLLTVSMGVSIVIGLYQGYKGRRATPESYLMGSRKMKPMPLALSMMVGTVSAITILANAGEMYAYGTQLWLMDLGMVVALVVIARLVIPVIHPMGVVSLYEYIEQRFSSRRLREATVVLQLVGGYFFMGFLLYPPAVALHYFTGLNMNLNIFFMGATCTVYSSFGGVKAVVYTDVFQAVVMVAGVAAIVVLGSVNAGGLDQVWDIAFHHGRTQLFNFSMNPYQRHSFMLCLVLGFFFAIGLYGVNQSQSQRYYSTASVRDAQKVLYTAAAGMVILRGLINLSGLAIFSHYHLCGILGPTSDPTSVVVPYVISVLTRVPGLAGIFVAAVYAAVLSSVSTQLNAMTALLWADFLKPLPYFASWSDVKAGTLQKVIVLGSGVVAVLLGLVVSQLGRSFLTVLLTINGALSGPLIGLFFVALALPWVKMKGAAAGFICSIVLSVWFAVGQLVYMSKEPYLPQSTEGCPITLPNTTLTNTTLSNTTLTNTSLAPTTVLTTLATLTNTTLTQPLDDANTELVKPEVHWLYGLSYCLNSFVGVFICVLVAVIVTVITGPNTPEDVDERLVDARMWAWFVNGCSTRDQGEADLDSPKRQKEEKVEEIGEPEEKESLPCYT